MKIGFLTYRGLTNLDLAGPYEVLTRLPGAQTCLVGKTSKPVLTDTRLVLKPNRNFNNAPPLDVVVIPGGPGINPLLNDPQTLSWLRKCALKARYITSVCTGSLLLGAAGLLKDRRATTHWAAMDFLARLGAIPVRERVVSDGPFVTGGGVTAGIDFGLALASQLADEATAKEIQLALEYNPAPPFNAGSPETAGADIVAGVRKEMENGFKARAIAVDQAVERLMKEAKPFTLEIRNPDHGNT